MYWKPVKPERPAPMPPLDALRYAGDCHCFEPHSWTRGKISRLSNCYAYIINSPIENRAAWFPQPGQFGLSFWRYLLSQIVVTKKIMVDAAIADGLIPHDPVKPVPAGYYLAALTIKPGILFWGDYHWYRLDYDRLRGGFIWTHKHGRKPPSNRDEQGAVIRDLPNSALIKKYPQWGGYFLVPYRGLPILKKISSATQPPAVLRGA